MVFNAKNLDFQSIALGSVLAYVAILLLAEFVPLVLNALVNMTATIFAGTPFAGIFGTDGIAIYGLFAGTILVFVFKLLGMKTKGK